MRKIIGALIGFAAAGAISAQGLDAPIPQTPTVRSEIKNGYDTGEACDRYDTPAEAIDPCFDRIATQYRVNHPSSAAFLVGLNIRKWMAGAKFVKIASQLPGNTLASDYARTGRISAGQAEIDVDTGISGLKITLDQAFAAADVAPANRPASALNQ